MTEPESYGPEGGHMGITFSDDPEYEPWTRGFAEDARRTEVDLEDTGAALSVAQRRVAELEARVAELEDLLDVYDADWNKLDGNRDAEETRESEQQR